VVGTRQVVPPTSPSLAGVSPPDRRLPVLGSSSVRPARGGDTWWLLGVHGGAGVSSLVRAGAGGKDADRAWRADGSFVAVARRTAYGLEWARDAARQHAAGYVSADVLLAGLVVVADAPGRTPKRLSAFLDLICGAYARVWEVPWVEEWRLAGHAEPLPTPPLVRQLSEDMRALTGAHNDQETE